MYTFTEAMLCLSTRRRKVEFKTPKDISCKISVNLSKSFQCGMKWSNNQALKDLLG